MIIVDIKNHVFKAACVQLLCNIEATKQLNVLTFPVLKFYSSQYIVLLLLTNSLICDLIFDIKK